MVVELAYPDGNDVLIGSTQAMLKLINAIGEKPELKTLSKIDLLNGAIENDSFQAIIDELGQVECEDCPVIQNLIDALQSAIDENDEYVIML